uniref:BAG domain-containing protein n=1 Tax=Prorocentrum micans TaxID=2945 RepID=A0A7S2TFH4_PROMC|mmetsp:Transcript_10761/g.13457  ORF Transcript_10761/g.13457 Transcript_10761/m.13457 type:complete len:373 (+) Transcript_10761:155-1273(+)
MMPSILKGKHNCSLSSTYKDLKNENMNMDKNTFGVNENGPCADKDHVEAGVMERINMLKEISQKIEGIALQLETAKRHGPQLAAKLAHYKWYFNTFKKTWSAYDVLASSKHRTYTSGCVEALMRILCELDQVQSNGNQEIREYRKKLVARINKELLPEADNVLLKAKSLLSFTESILDIVNANIAEREMKKRETSIENTDDMDNNEMKKSETSIDSNVDMDDSDVEETQNKVDTDVDMNEENDVARNKRAAKQDIPKRVIKRPRYDIREVDDAVVVRLELPASDTPESIHIKLEDDGDTLAIYGNEFTLPFAVNQRNYNVSAASYKFLHRGRLLQVNIPKHRRRNVYRQPRQYSPFSTNFNRYPSHPMGWAW